MTGPLKFTSPALGVSAASVAPASQRFRPGWWLVPAALAGLMLWGLVGCAAIGTLLN